MKRAGSMLLLVVLLLTTLLACGDHERAREFETSSPSDAGAAAADDTTELRRIYDAIDTHHERLMAGYRQMEGQMGGDFQQMYDDMALMHGRAVQMHHGMMGEQGHGMMGMMGRDEQNQGMMGRGMQGHGMMEGGMMRRHQTREWDRQMVAMHQQMSRYMRQQGHDEMADLHEQMTQYYGDAAEALPEADGEASAAPPSPEGEVSGREVYQQNCASCHGTTGQGIGGAFPPLAGADWVTRDAETPIRIVLHGLQGPIQVQGESFDGTMPAFGARLSNEEVAAVLSYVRSRWGNEAPAVTAGTVRSVREANPGRAQPWTPDALR